MTAFPTPIRPNLSAPAQAPLTEARIREIIREEIEWAMRITRTSTARTARRDRDRDRETLQPIADDYKSGLTLLQCATKHGCSMPRVSRALRVCNVPPRMKGPPVKASEHLPRMTEMREAGKPLEEIAAEFKLTRERVRQILNKAGIKTSQDQRPPTPEQRAAVDRYIAGENIETAAASIGVCAQTFHGLVTKCGHTPRKRIRATTVRFNRQALKVAALKAGGMSAADIAREMGLKHVNHVYRCLSRARGLQIRAES